MNIFELLIIYQIKHFLADYLLQGRYMLGKFLDHGWVKPLLAHVVVHGVMTAGIAVWAGKSTLALPLAALDATIHFIMDRIKAGNKYLGRYKPLDAVSMKQVLLFEQSEGPLLQGWAKKKLFDNKMFWNSLGFDQMIHHFTHYLCIYFLIS